MEYSRYIIQLHFVFIITFGILASYTFVLPQIRFSKLEFDDSIEHELSDHDVNTHIDINNEIQIEPPRIAERIVLQDTIRFTAYHGSSRRLRIEIVGDSYRSHIDYHNSSCYSIKRRPLKLVEQKLVINKTKFKNNLLIGHIYCKAELPKKYLMDTEYLTFEWKIAKQLHDPGLLKLDKI